MTTRGIVGLMRFVNERDLPIEQVRSIYERAKRNVNTCGLFVAPGALSLTLNDREFLEEFIQATDRTDDPGYLRHKMDLRDREVQRVTDARNPKRVT